jgi:hypothetical protein
MSIYRKKSNPLLGNRPLERAILVGAERSRASAKQFPFRRVTSLSIFGNVSTFPFWPVVLEIFFESISCSPPSARYLLSPVLLPFSPDGEGDGDGGGEGPIPCG